MLFRSHSSVHFARGGLRLGNDGAVKVTGRVALVSHTWSSDNEKLVA